MKKLPKIGDRVKLPVLNEDILGTVTGYKMSCHAHPRGGVAFGPAHREHAVKCIVVKDTDGKEWTLEKEQVELAPFLDNDDEGACLLREVFAGRKGAEWVPGSANNEKLKLIAIKPDLLKRIKKYLEKHTK